jgi:EpsI family protein
MPRGIHKNFLPLLHFSLLLGGISLLYWSTFVFWINTWITNFECHFGFIIPFLAGYIVWVRWDQFQTTSILPSKWGLPVIFAGILFYVGGQLAFVSIARQFSFFIVIFGIILYYFGFSILKLAVIPIIILLFMMPLPDFVYSYFQSFYTQATGVVLRFFNLAVLTEGYSIQCSDVSVWVAPGCTGIRSLTAILPIGLALAHLQFNSGRKKLYMILFSAVLPILSNLFRIVTLLVLAIMGHPILVSGTPHKIQGYVFFIGALFLLFGFASFLERHEFKPLFLREKIQPEFGVSERSWFAGFSSFRKFIVVTFLLLLPLIANARLSSQTPIPLLQTFQFFPSQLGDWQGMEIASNEWRPKVIGATNVLARRYWDTDGNEVEIFLSYLPIQMQGKELVFHANRIIPGEFMAVRQQVKVWKLDDMRLKTNVLISNKSIHQEILIYWYRNTDHYFYNRYQAKIAMIFDSFWQNQSNGAVFVLKFKDGSSKPENNQSSLEDFLSIFMKEIEEYLPS